MKLHHFLRRLYEIAEGSGERCWVWPGPFSMGYGYVGQWRGKNVTAHRLAWEIFNGRRVPPRMCICHHCDNRPCCNPAHLFLGTYSDNTVDSYRKGRRKEPRTHCVHGHELTPRSTRVAAINKSTGLPRLVCLVCEREQRKGIYSVPSP